MEIFRNKNVLMLFTVAVYILSLVCVFYNFQLTLVVIITIFAILAILKKIFPLKYIFIWTIIFYFGIFNASFRLKDTDDLLNIAPRNSIIYGQILSIPQAKENKQKFFFKVNKIEYDSKVKEFDNEKTFVTLTNCKKSLKIYDYYKIKGYLAIPFKAGNPSQFDYGNYLRNFDTYSVFYAKNCDCIENLKNKKSASENILQKINDYREIIINKHSKYIKSPNLELLGGIVFGDDAITTPDDIKQSFANSGLLHILAASGMNVAFIFSFFYFFLSLFKINYRANITFCIFMVLVYSLMTGLGASVVRATLMLVLVLIGKLIDRDTHSLALLAFVAFLMLIYNPMYLNDVGFQLSFVVTFGLLLTAPYFLKSKNKIINWLIGTITVPIVAQLWVMPLQIFYFSNISFYSVFANVLTVPILSIVSFAGFISSLTGLIIPEMLFKVFDFILEPLLGLIINISDFWGNLPHSTAQTTHPSILQIILYYTSIICITLLFNSEIRGKYLKQILGLLLFLFFSILLTLISIPNKNLEITVFDVGNADSFLIKTPSSEYILIDSGKSGYKGGKSQAEIILLKYFKDNSIKKLNSFIITHFDNDHSGGASDIIKNLKVEKVFVNSLNNKSLQAQLLYNSCKSSNTKLIETKNNNIIYNNQGLKITNFINPYIKENDDNEASIISLLEYNNFKILFMGDAGVKTFDSLKRNFPQNITVLKVGHHGALGSINKNMITHLNPQISLISVGENKFGHPSIYTLEMLKNTKILRTDTNNSIKIIVNSNGYKILTYDILERKYK